MSGFEIGLWVFLALIGIGFVWSGAETRERRP